jgi:hypothetical protein
MKKRAFTLVEVLIASGVLVLFMIGVYQLYTGGAKNASRGQWINTSVNELRNATTILQREMDSATYPTTLFSDRIYDPCSNSSNTVASKYYLKIKKDGQEISVPSTGEETVMTWVVCSPEKPPNSAGKIVEHELVLAYHDTQLGQVLGKLVLKTNTNTFKSDAQTNYAQSGKLNITKIEKESGSRVLVSDVTGVEFMVGGVIPPEKPVDFLPISVKIYTMYPKDDKVKRENSFMSTPQVGIDLL